MSAAAPPQGSWQNYENPEQTETKARSTDRRCPPQTQTKARTENGDVLREEPDGGYVWAFMEKQVSSRDLYCSGEK